MAEDEDGGAHEVEDETGDSIADQEHEALDFG
jgi:hypothetical protein